MNIVPQGAGPAREGGGVPIVRVTSPDSITQADHTCKSSAMPSRQICDSSVSQSMLSTSAASALSAEVWAQIFSHLTEEVVWEVNSLALESPHERHDPAEEYSSYHRLRTVCKLFRQAFEENSDLSACLFLDQDFD